MQKYVLGKGSAHGKYAQRGHQCDMCVNDNEDKYSKEAC